MDTRKSRQRGGVREQAKRVKNIVSKQGSNRCAKAAIRKSKIIKKK